MKEKDFLFLLHRKARNFLRLFTPLEMPACPVRYQISNVVMQKYLYFNCHSGLDPESSVFGLDSRLRGNDSLGVYVKKC